MREKIRKSLLILVVIGVSTGVGAVGMKIATLTVAKTVQIEKSTHLYYIQQGRCYDCEILDRDGIYFTIRYWRGRWCYANYVKVEDLFTTKNDEGSGIHE